MKVVLRRVVAATLGLSLVAAVAIGGAVEVAKARPGSGTSSVVHAGRSSDIGASTQFQEGDTITVPTDGTLVVEFGDGSSIELVGPASMRFLQMSPTGRRVVLLSGVVSEA